MLVADTTPRPLERRPWSRSRLVVVSNRRPIQVSRTPDGEWSTRCSSGGSVTALLPVLRRVGLAWVGWSGPVEGDPPLDVDLCDDFQGDFDLQPVSLSREEWDSYHLWAANAAIWPILLGFHQHRELGPRDWELYRSVNRRFARHVPLESDRDLIGVQDYHLVLLAEDRVPVDRRPVGLQRPRGDVLPDIGHFPISIDAEDWSRAAVAASVARHLGRIRREVGADAVIVLGVDEGDVRRTPAR